MERDAVVMWAPGDLMIRLRQVEAAARFEAGVWFYPSGHTDDDHMVETLSHCAASIVLVPGPGADAATRRPASFSVSSASDYSLITTAT